MRFVRILPYITVITLFLSLGLPAWAQSPAGKEFLVALPSLMDLGEMNRDIADFTVEVSCTRLTNVTLRWADGTPIMTSLVEPGLRATFKRPLYSLWQIMQSPLDFDSEKPNRRAFRISADQPVTVQCTFDTLYRAETYQVFPISSYDTAYTVVNYAGYGGGGDRTGFIVMASDDNTDVRITPSVQTWKGNAPGTEYTIRLMRNQVVQVASTFKSTGRQSDVTGTMIRSNRPVGVLSYSAGSSIPSNGDPGANPPGGNIDYEGSFSTKLMIEHQSPQSMAGTEFYTMPFIRRDPSRLETVRLIHPPGGFRTRRDTSRLRFVALQSGTTLDTNGVRVKTPGGADSTLGRGGFFEVSITGPMKVTASRPVLGMQFMYSGYSWMSFDSIFVNGSVKDTVQIPFGNPSMCSLPPVSQFKPNLQLSVPQLDERPAPPGIFRATISWRHTMLITAPASAAGKVKVNGTTVNLPYTHSDGTYISGYVRVFGGLRELIESPEPISVLSYGMTWYDSYATTAGESPRSVAVVGPDTLRFFICSNQKDTAITLANRGTGDFRLDSVRVTGIAATLLAPASLPRTYVGNSQDILLFRFSAAVPGTYTGSIKLYTDANNQAVLEVPFVITRDSAKLGLPAGVIDFGALKSTQTQRDTTIALRNNGVRPLVIDTITFSAPGYTLLGTTFPRTIAPGGVDSIRVRFTPSADGLAEATMRIAGTPCLQAVDVVLRGFKGSGATVLVSRLMLFGTYLCFAPATVDSTMALRNIGDEPVVISTATITGVNKDEFALLDPLDGVSVPPGDTLRYRVRYIPAGYGERRATLHLVTNAKNAPQIDISLVARKDTVALVPAVDTLQFGRVLACGDTLERTLTVRNTGTVADTITAADFGGLTAYLVGTPLPIVLNPFTSQDITVRFAPGADGAFGGTLRLHGTPCDVETSVALSGERVTPSLAATPLQFDTVYACEAASVRRVIVTNTGVVPATVTGAGDGGSGVLVVQNRTFPREIAPGASDTFYVTFNPPADGAYSGTLRFVWGPCNGQLDVPAAGFRATTEVALSDGAIDFGTVNINTPVRRTVTLHNRGTVVRSVTGLTTDAGVPVRVLQPATLPAEIAPGDSLVVELEYLPTVKGAMASSLRVSIAAPCGGDTVVPLGATAVGDEIINSTLTLVAPVMQGEVDRTVEIPIVVEGWDNVDAVKPSALTVRLRYRYTLLAPLSVTTPLAGVTASVIGKDVVGDDRIVTIELAGIGFPSNGEIARLQCLVLIGDTDVTALDLDSAFVTTPPNRVVTAALRDGAFTTLGICRTGGDRFVRIPGRVRLKSAHPNPFRDAITLEYENDREMPITLRLYDAAGTPVSVMPTGTMLAGAHSARFDGRMLPSGPYVLEIEGGGERLRMQVVLAK